MIVVLIAEDDPEINELMALTLRMEGYQVVQARDGEQALECVKQQEPDLILLDVMMPRISGYGVARTLQENDATSHIPIIFVTAKHEMEDLVHGLELAVDYVCKPFAMPELLARVRAALRMSKLQEDLRSSNEQLARLAVTDELTGISNRRGFDAHLEDELWRARRFGQSLAIVMFDLDHFKSVNDTYGHDQGDVVLKAFAEVLHHSSRRIDKVARFGGEEFAALLPATDAIGAETFAEKVRAATEALEIPRQSLDGQPVPPMHVTVSGGAAVAHAIDQDEENILVLTRALVQAADRCLYKAKGTGRNRIVVDNIETLSATTSA